jgi:hypothetical protein
MTKHESNAAKITIGLISVILITTAIFTSKLLSDDYDSNRTYDGSFQIVRYNYNQRYNSVSITVKDQDSNKVITASVPRDCPNQPVNKIIDATINEKTKDFFGLFEENYYSIVSGKVCL